MVNLKEINTQIFAENIRSRGYAYFRDQRVESTKLTGNEVRGVVIGTIEYHVLIRFNQKMFPYFRTCDCPYPEKGACKHVSATLFQLNSIGFFTTKYYVEQIHDALGIVNEESEPQEEVIAEVKPELPKAFREREQEAVQKAVEGRNIAGEGDVTESIAKQAVMQQIEQTKKGLDDVKNREQLRLFHHRMDMLLLPDKKLSKTGYSKQFMLSLYIENRTRTLTPILVTLKKGVPSSMRPIEEKDLREATDLPGNLFMALLSTMDIAYTPFQFPTFQATFQTAKEEFVNAIFARVFDMLKGSSIRLRFDRRQDGFSGDQAYIAEEPGAAMVKIFRTEKGIKAVLELTHPDFGLLQFKQAVPVSTSPLWFLYQRQLIRIDDLHYKQYLAFAVTDGEISIGGSHAEIFEQEYIPVLPRHLRVDSDYYQFRKENVIPEKRLYITEHNENLLITLRFAYGTEELGSGGPAELRLMEGDSVVIMQRNREFEQEAVEKLKAYDLRQVGEDVYIPKTHPVDFLLDTVPVLREQGFLLFGESELENFNIVKQQPAIRLKVASGIDWFSVDASLDFGDELIPLADILRKTGKEIRYIRLGNNKIARLADFVARKLSQHTSLAELTEDGQLRFTLTQAGAVMALLEEDGDAVIEPDAKDYLDALKNFSGIKKVAIPENLHAELRSYQMHGLNWLCFLQSYRFGGILADDMGLGKTLQVLTLLLHQKNKGQQLPSLIVAPTSVVFNWIAEAEKFTPDLTLLNYTGLDRKQNSFEHFKDFDVIVTSYGVVLRDFESLAALPFHYIILDESQKIKNPVAKSSRLIRKLQAEHRLCLSGTPVENNLTELWSQMAFLNPGMLGTLASFQEHFVKPVQREDAEQEMDYLRKLMYPFILRRTKDLVAKELPPKTEIIHYCEMEPEQAQIYQSVLNSVRTEVIEHIEENGLEKSGIKVIEALLRLRQVCNHPSLINESIGGGSGKFDEFKEMIVSLVGEGHKVLVFSQFVSMLEMMKNYLDRIGIRHEYLTGQTKNREIVVKNFQDNPDIRAMLISLKAGGFGLNLTSADNVFLYDPWWNPAVEQQAADRSHRIGQDKNVFIYKFITKGTVEEKILHLQDNKRQLIEKILTTEKGLLKKLTRKDIDYLLG